MSHPNKIKLGGVELTEQSYEVARVWVTHEAGSSAWIDAGVLEDPKTFGYLMADVVRQAAFACGRRFRANSWRGRRARLVARGFFQRLLHLAALGGVRLLLRLALRGVTGLRRGFRAALGRLRLRVLSALAGRLLLRSRAARWRLLR